MARTVTETPPKPLEIQVNGELKTIPPGLSVLGLIRELGIEPERVAVELNRGIVRQTAWDTTPVEAGAQVEIVQFVGGG
jgi:thiamine biosynthesis protein ThiS